MRYKVVPEPRSLSFLETARRTIPLAPDSVDDCCGRLLAETDVIARDDARDWITFMEALGLVEETDRGYRRFHESDADGSAGSDDDADGIAEVDADALAVSFRENVFGAREVLDALAAADGPRTADAVFDDVADVVPDWERNRDPDWKRAWRERVERLLEWGVLFGLVERTDGTYRPAE
ncbi:MAG: hypothetical protein ABEI96_04805 [Haloarculaceae archaeon]